MCSSEAIVLRAIAKNRDERFQSVDELAAAIHPFRHIDAAPTVAEPPPRSALQPSSSGTTGLAWTQGTAPEPGAEPPVRSKAPIIAGVAVLGFLVIAGVGIALGVTGAFGGEPARTPPVVVAPPVMPPPARPTPPPPPAAIPPPVPAEVEITISATPSDARVFFGESEYPNGVPFNVPRSLVPVRVRVERRGYRTIEQTTLFDRPRALTFEMRRGRGVQAIEDDSSAAPPERRVERTASPPETPPETTPPNRPPPPTLTKLPSRDWE